MSYVLLDRYIELVSGEYGKAVKTVSHKEAFLDTESSPYPIMPASLVIETQAQVAGILAAFTMDFKSKSVLGKLDRAEFFRPVGPGDCLEITARIDSTMEESKGRNFLVSTTVEVDGVEVARMRSILAALDLDSSEGRHFDTTVFKREREDLLRTTGVLELLNDAHRELLASGF